MVVLLLEHSSRQVVLYACGTLVNLAAEPCSRATLLELRTSSTLLELMQEATSQNDGEVVALVLQVLYNLRYGEGWVGGRLLPSSSCTPDDGGKDREVH